MSQPISQSCAFFTCNVQTTNMRLHRYGNALVQFDPKAEAKLRTKIDLMIVPTVALLYLFCFIDRANIGMLPRPAKPPTLD